LRDIPYALRTEEVCKAALEHNGGSLKDVPQSLQPSLKHLLRPPIATWDVSLLDELAAFLEVPSSPTPSVPRHAQ
jgi:hypothetical protein